MSNITKLWLFTLCFLVAEYAVGTDDCIGPGLQNEITGVNIEVPVRKSSDNLEIHWVDSGEIISKEGQESENTNKITFTIDGVINLCPANNESKTLVPATFCNDKKVPNYDDAKNIENAEDDLGRELSKVCDGKNVQNNKRRYVDTGIKVNSGDQLSFSLIPRQIKIDCNSARSKQLFDQEKIVLDEIQNNDGTKVDFLKVCTGRFSCPDSDEKGTNVQFQSLDGQSYDVLVGKGYTPYDNKVYRDFNPNKFDTSGTLLDLRRCSRHKLTDLLTLSFPDLKKLSLGKAREDKIANLCSHNRNPEECIEWQKKEMLKRQYNVYELNCFNNKICYNQSGIGSDCFSSIRYQKYDEDNSYKCNMDAYLAKLEDKMQEMTSETDVNHNTMKDIINKNQKDPSWAESLVAKIVSSDRKSHNTFLPNDLRKNDLRLDSQGIQCFPEKKNGKCALIEDSDFEKFSLQLDHEYTVGAVDHDSSVMLAIAGRENDRYDLYRGGYYVKIRKSCNFMQGKKLYLYIGNSPPEKIDQSSLGDANMFYYLGGELNSSILSQDGKEENGNVIYTIDKSKLADNGNNKIYFGVDVRNVARDDLMSGSTYNKYTISMSVGRRINDYVSSIVKNILDYVKGIMIGKNIIQDTYKGIAKGLLYSIRSLLALYIIFSVVGYMLGTVQVGMNDFIIRIVKIACVVLAISENSWKFFGENLYILFIDGSVNLIDGFAGYGNRESRGPFGFLDETVGVLFSAETWLKFLSLALAGPFGFVACLGIMWASVIFLKCMIIAIVRYIIATVLVGFLLVLAPLFIVFVLFQTTSRLLTGWIQMMAGVSLQPVIAFSLLSLLSKLLYPIFYNITNFSACYECLFSINILGSPFCIFKAIWPSGYDPNASVGASSDMGGTLGSLPIDIIQALIYFILANVIDQFVVMSEQIAESLFSSIGTRQVVSGIASSASQSVLRMVGLDRGTQAEIANIKHTMNDSLLERTGRTDSRLTFNSKDISKVSKGPDERAKDPSQSHNMEKSSKETVRSVDSDTDSG